jgi:hypothetical protein
MKRFLLSMVSEGGEVSFGRVSAGLWSIACIAWNTYHLISLPGHPLPAGSDVAGQSAVIASCYGLSKAGETVQQIFSKTPGAP